MCKMFITFLLNLLLTSSLWLFCKSHDVIKGEFDVLLKCPLNNQTQDKCIGSQEEDNKGLEEILQDEFLFISENLTNILSDDAVEGSGSDESPAVLLTDYLSSCKEPGSDKICSNHGECSNNICICHSEVFDFPDAGNRTINETYRFSGKYCEECPYCRGQRCQQFLPCIECKVLYQISTCRCAFQTKEVARIERVLENNDKMCELENQDGCFFKFKYSYDLNNIPSVEFEKDIACFNGFKGMMSVFWGVVLLIILIIGLIPAICPKMKFQPNLNKSSWQTTQDIVRVDQVTFE